MEKEVVKNNNGNNINNHHQNHSRERGGRGGDGLYRSHHSETRSSTADFGLQWGNRKRLRCMKIQVKDESAPVHKTTVRVDRRVVRTDKDSLNNNNNNNNNHNSNGYPNLRQRPSSPPLPPPQRVLRNSEISIAMKGQSNGVRGFSSPDRGEQRAQDKKVTNNNNNDSNVGGGGGGGGGSASSETAHDSKKGGSSSGSEAIPAVWPPKFVIALTNKEKEEDFMAIKGSKLPQRPKKRAKFIQRTLNLGPYWQLAKHIGHMIDIFSFKLVSPGTWLCDLTLERYEVREKKISKKRPRGLKAMGNMESDSE